MINFYCQYSFGGFRTFRINGTENEALKEQEVTSSDPLDFPTMGSVYFNYGGAKLLYRVFDSGELAVIVREIPGVERDTDGRLINCALQIIASPDEKALMDNVALEIINTLPKFEKDFAAGFSLRGGLHYNGEFLTNFVEKLRGKVAETSAPQLEDLAEHPGPVYLFVPSSPLFMNDPKLQAKVVRELHLGSESSEIKNTLAATISPSKLPELVGSVNFVAASTGEVVEEKHTDEERVVEEVADIVTETKTDDPNAGFQLHIIDLERNIEQLEGEKAKAVSDAEALRAQIRQILEKNLRMRQIVYGLGLGCGALALGWILTALLK